MKRLGFCNVKTYCCWLFLFIFFVGLFTHIGGIPIAGAYLNSDTDVISYLDAEIIIAGQDIFDKITGGPGTASQEKKAGLFERLD